MRKFTFLFTFLICSIYIGSAQAPPTVSGTTSVCSGSNTTLTASGDPGATFAWYDASSGGNLLSSSFELTTGSLTSTIHFYVEQTVGASTTPRADVVVTVTPLPSPLSPINVMASPANICEGENTDLSATVDAANNQKVHWYDAASGGNLLGVSASGSPFTVSPANTTTYYAQSQIEVINTTFNYTGGVQTFTVPAGVTSIEVDAYGAEGGNTYSTTGSGKGGRVQATMSVTPGQVLNIYVGGKGTSYSGYSGSLAGGWNGGARGSTWGQGAGGGGATDIRINGTATTDRVLVAGGAGGKGPTCTNTGLTPHGGGLTGASGSYCNTGPAEGLRGHGGSPTTGGRAGCWWSGSYCGGTGSFGNGGVGGDYYGAGGGGGWYGGGGAVDRGDGGGGSSYTDPSLCSYVTHTQGVRSGHGLLTITYSLGIDCATTAREPITVTVVPLPTVIASSDAYTCPGVGVSISASGADTYSWEPGSLTGASVSVDPSSTTTYTVTGTTTVGGCTATDQVTLTVTDVVASPDQTICEGSSATLTASGAVTYTWEPGSLSGASVSVNPTTTTTYTVTGHDPSGCTTTDQVTVTVNPIPSPVSPSSIVSNPGTICEGESSDLSATVDVANFQIIKWYTAASGGSLLGTSLSGEAFTVSPTTTTTYYAQSEPDAAHPSYDCASDTRTPVTVNVIAIPPVVANADVYSCPGVGVTLTVSGADTYSWEPGSLSGASITVDPSVTTTYTVVGTTATGGCTASDQVVVTISDVVASADQSICENGSATLTASGAATYTWEPGSLSGSSVSVSPATTTTYTVTGHDPSGCTTTDDVTVTVNPNPIVTASNDTVIVNGTSANLSASGADTYTWSPGSLSGANVSVSPSTTTTYTVTGRYASTNCPNTDQVTVGVVSLPSIVGITTVLLGESTTLTASGTGGATFEWYDAETGGNLLSSDPTLTTSNLTQNSVFYVALNDGVNTSPRVPVNVTAIDSTLVSVGAAEASICPGSGTDLGASLNSPGVINWYDDATGTNLIGTTDPGVGLYVTPATTTTYYAKGITQEKVVTFNYTGGVQTFTVPAGVTSIDIDAYGAQGGNSYSTSGPGLGGRVQATMNVTPGQILNIYVGGQGQSYAGYGSQLLGGWNGGGHGTNTGQGGGGGGATDIRIAGTSLNDRVLVAGGAGGKSPVTCTLGSSAFPHGGGLTGAAGSYCTGGSGEAKRGLGGTQTTGGRPGCWHSGTSCAGGGSFGYGGTGGSVSGNGRAGGGGGGWYGGGGGTYNSDGGGGSSYTKTGLCHNVTHTQGVRSGHGMLVLTYSKNSVNNTLSPTSITVEDVAAPVPNIPSLPDIQGDAPVTALAPNATDVCEGAVTATTMDPTTYDVMGTYTIQWDYDDGNGNFSSQNQTIIVNTTLPVELTSFTAKCEGQKVILKWITESEINSSHFEVQRSKDGIHWESFGRIQSAGDSQVTQNYQFTELSRFEYNLYRLMQVDLDGTIAHSDIISTDCEGEDTKVNIYPNPSNGDFSVSFQGEGEETLELSILDELGLVIETKSIQLSNGWQQTTFSLADYPTGFYKLQVKGQYQMRTYRVIKIQE